MGLSEVMHTIRNHQRFTDAGMVLIHNGVVRRTSRDGAGISRLLLEPDRAALKEILEQMKQRPGIIEIIAEVNEGELVPGDDIMIVAVAGDYRENVVPVLVETVELIKTQVTKKTEM